MEFLVFLLFIAISIGVGAKNSKQAKARQQQNTAARPAPPAAPRPAFVPDTTFGGQPVPRPAYRNPVAAAPNVAEMSARNAEPPAATHGSLTYQSLEGIGLEQDAPARGSADVSIRHTVRPFTESDHLHVESSLMDAEDCPPEEAEPGDSVDAYTPTQLGGLVWNHAAVTQGILYAEILGKPRALRR
ncbi:MAG: hypothetical protein LBN26_09515 [Christensenellaceae bacterium]|jgi:hypothetical protein|nr:hypothetical protein [Christensenellaceae bacterium]